MVIKTLIIISDTSYAFTGKIRFWVKVNGKYFLKGFVGYKELRRDTSKYKSVQRLRERYGI